MLTKAWVECSFHASFAFRLLFSFLEVANDSALVSYLFTLAGGFGSFAHIKSLKTTVLHV